MTQHLLHIALGPVQDFIAQARRTGDLWYGSHLISELSRTAARILAKTGAQLLIPYLDAPELERCDGITRRDGTHPLAVANKLYALVPAGVLPFDLASVVRAAVAADLKERADAIRTEFRGFIPHDVDAVWSEQVDTFLDFTAAWTPYPDGDDLAEARQRVDEAAGARRQLRDFSPWVHHRGNVPKSSLDGMRETVLPPAEARDKQLKRLYGIAQREELDAIGLLKRGGGSSQRFVPIINVALAPWLAHLAAHAPELLASCREACNDLGVQRISKPAWTGIFPLEASILLPSRWDSLIKEQEYSREGPAWENVESKVRALHNVLDPYEPYVACLVADGDRMGDALTKIAAPAALQDFSRQLSKFARGARAIVEAHHGALVYAGGDDVLAFVPVAAALACAAALHDSFEATMREACRAAAIEPIPTLSVGLGIGHYMESMGTLLELGRRAERVAKGGALGAQARDALAVVVHKRSGSECVWRMRWPEQPHARLEADQRLFEAGLPLRKVHELAAIVRRLPAPHDLHDDDAPGFDALLVGEVRRTLGRAGLGGGSELDLESLMTDLTPIDATYEARHQRISARSAQLLIARAFHEATPRPIDAPGQG